MTSKRKSNPNRIGGANTAMVCTTIPTVPILVNTPYQFQLAGIVGARALAMAPNFAFYRVAKVAFKYKPKYDTFISSTVTLPGQNAITTVPTLYWKMNRFADNPANFTSDDLRVLGAIPKRFDDKQVSIAYKPNVLTSMASGGTNSGALKMTPWLNTDSAPDTNTFFPSTTNHYGHFWYVEADLVNSTTTPIVGTLDVEIFYEFKNPRVEWTRAGVDQKMTIGHSIAVGPTSAESSLEETAPASEHAVSA